MWVVPKLSPDLAPVLAAAAVLAQFSSLAATGYIAYGAGDFDGQNSGHDFYGVSSSWQSRPICALFPPVMLFFPPHGPPPPSPFPASEPVRHGESGGVALFGGLDWAVQ